MSKKDRLFFLASLTLERFYRTAKEENDSFSKSYSVQRLLSLSKISADKSRELFKCCLADSGYSSRIYLL